MVSDLPLVSPLRQDVSRDRTPRQNLLGSATFVAGCGSAQPPSTAYYPMLNVPGCHPKQGAELVTDPERFPFNGAGSGDLHTFRRV